MSIVWTRTVTIDADGAIDMLEAAVADKGSTYNYLNNHGSCQYVRDEHGACVVGYGLETQGVDVVAVFGNEDCEIAGVLSHGAGVPQRMAERGVILTDEAVDVLRAAQEAQDGGLTWGDGLIAAYRVRLAQVKVASEPPF